MTRRRGARFGPTALLVIVIVIVVVGSAGAGSPVAAGQTPPVVPTAPTTPRGTVSYLLHASFAIGYGVEWSEEQGDPETEWVPWRVDSGTNEMHAGTYVTKKNGGIEDVWIPGHAAIYPRPLRTGRQEGGPHSRPSAKSHRNPPPEMDSGGRLELDAQLRKRRPRTLPAVSERLCRGPRARVHHEDRGRARRHASRDVDRADRPGAIRETGREASEDACDRALRSRDAAVPAVQELRVGRGDRSWDRAAATAAEALGNGAAEAEARPEGEPQRRLLRDMRARHWRPV